jgi:hypothetical protein
MIECCHLLAKVKNILISLIRCGIYADGNIDAGKLSLYKIASVLLLLKTSFGTTIKNRL